MESRSSGEQISDDIPRIALPQNPVVESRPSEEQIFDDIPYIALPWNAAVEYRALKYRLNKYMILSQFRSLKIEAGEGVIWRLSPDYKN